ncbi:unnamed protein product, partial [marine sediment metagenome]
MGTRDLSIGITQEALVKSDRRRKSLTIFNTHATQILYFREGKSVVATTGIPVYPGGNVGITFEDDGELVFERFVII